MYTTALPRDTIHLEPIQVVPFPKRQRIATNSNIMRITEPERPENWYWTIQNDAILFDTMYKISKFIMANDEEETRKISINGYDIARLNATEITNPSVAGELILNCIIDWYSSQTSAERFKYDPLIPGKMLEALIQLEMSDERPNNDVFSNKHRLLTQFGALINQFNKIHERFRPFFEWVYYNKLVPFISKNRLKFVSKIGSGSQANVLKVRDITNSELFALKLFEKLPECLHEFNILSTIYNEFDDSTNVKIPRVVKGEDIHRFSISCHSHRGMLMEFIDGVPFRKLNISTQNEAISIWNQLSSAIKVLGHKGIGHFDINDGNVLKDKDDKYWLIDWGLAKIIKKDTTPLRLLAAAPVYGTWCYYSPHALKLSEMMNNIGKKLPEQISLDQLTSINQLTIDANLYSLQAMMFMSIKYNKFNDWKIMKLHRELNDEWDFHGMRQITSAMVEILHKIWRIRVETVAVYANDKLDQHILQQEHINMLLQS